MVKLKAIAAQPRSAPRLILTACVQIQSSSPLFLWDILILKLVENEPCSRLRCCLSARRKHAPALQERASAIHKRNQRVRTMFHLTVDRSQPCLASRISLPSSRISVYRILASSRLHHSKASSPAVAMHLRLLNKSCPSTTLWNLRLQTFATKF